MQDEARINDSDVDSDSAPEAAACAAPAPVPLVPLHMPRRPVDVRNGSVALIALLASAYTLHWASAVFIPLLLGVLFSYALSPLVDGLQRWRVPRALGAGCLLLSVLGGIGFTGYSLLDDAAALIESLPAAAQKLRDSLRALPGAPEGTIGKVQRAAAKLEQAAEESGSATPAAGRGVTRVQIERRHFDIKDYLWSGTLGLAGFVGQATIVGFIAFFLMASGDSFRRKMARIAGPTFSRRKITIQALDQITGQIRRYLLVQVFTGVGVGAATWLAFRWIGLEHAAVWGVAAAVLNFVPYLGALAVSGGAALVGFLQFGTLGQALTAGFASLAIHTLSGHLVAPWLTSRASRMNPVAIFVGVLAWGWLWGVWGLLLGAPLLMVIKAVCDRVDEWLPVGELLGE
ncbi:MAG: AI-2E family transporter [Burkholderiales bacterium]|nr:AI-2E family transporter [Burkholderiales bacterium]MDE2393881.1 AI-2E family transporter [Burkholderiales bacterium]MDE2452594.1 AI-2E family transporter [Burkholderiales bacterium]